MQVQDTALSLVKEFTLASFIRNKLTPDDLKQTYLMCTRQQREVLLRAIAEAVVDARDREEYSLARNILQSISSTADRRCQQRLITLSLGCEGFGRAER